MKLWTRIRLGLGLLFGKKYGIIVDMDYAVGGCISGFEIVGADIGILQVGGWKRTAGRVVLRIEDNDMSKENRAGLVSGEGA